MSRFVRASKVRHVYAKNPKADENYSNFRLSTAIGDHNYIKANTKYMAFPIHQAGGSLAMISMDLPKGQRRLPSGVLPCIDGHRGPVLDFDFNPFQQQLIATGGDDCVCKIWGIPPEGLKESISESLGDMVGHDKKVTVVLHHPTAEWVLATGSADRTVKIWDVETQEEKSSTDHNEILYGCAWSSTGEVLASTARDKKLRLIDPRTGEVREELVCHDGHKTSKVVFIPNKGPGNSEAVCTVGFNRQAKRQFRLWDQRAMAKPYASVNVDQAAGVMLPFYDEDRNMLYLAGKGDANVRYYELVDGAPWQFHLDEFRTNEPCRGMCVVPSRALDVTKCEVTRMLKLCSDKVVPLSFICPRKSDLFQKDLYPDTYAGKASVKGKEWFEGKEGRVFKVSMDPKKKGVLSSGTAKPAAAKKNAPKSAMQLQRELREANAKIEKYEKLLKDNGISF
eukprot:augustus_masked-scaffold_2-processed-gene-27.16-mRNA-1 protein AED:0.05 eAED:0.05 QI:0/-1/0/1/-1/1/1/0/450